MEHVINPRLLDRRVGVHLVGVGGNGAQIAACLARLDIAMRALGHPGGLHVTAFDGDAVSEANVGRQLYSPADVGQNKALLTIHRLNLFYGLDWQARPWRYEEAREVEGSGPDIVVSCVDTRESRRALHRRLVAKLSTVSYWLDLGNTESTAQVVLGEALNGRTRGAPRLPCVTELFPQILEDASRESDTPSCSVRMALASQGLFVNDVVVRFAAQLLYELFSQGRLTTHGVMVNLASKRTAPIEVNPDVWERFGFGAGQACAVEPRRRRKAASTAARA